MAWIATIAQAAANVGMTAAAQQGNENGKYIKELKAKEKSGTFGLTDQEKQSMWNDTYGSANKHIEEERKRGDATMAATGNTSGGAMLAQQASRQAAAGQVAQNAANAIEQVDVQEAEAEKQELSDRLAIRRDNRMQLANSILGSSAQAGKTYGEYEGTTGKSLDNANKPSKMDGYTKADVSKMTPQQRRVYASYQDALKSGDPDLIEAAKIEAANEGLITMDEATNSYSDPAASTGTTAAGTTDSTTTGTNEYGE